MTDMLQICKLHFAVQMAEETLTNAAEWAAASFPDDRALRLTAEIGLLKGALTGVLEAVEPWMAEAGK
ncbi:hypothetical protein K4749_07450 [Streptomyces sp. TRM72054]|uniref:hypothetical protein n=1 Tax=Streptomyces sp. TRM72054 TaxID=2870562 RepID=UPI001C8C2C2E|nr:hypothetical protein [Streptomyces sp. TRM72054]MBX9393428.1 hypothetical protein [Streptomyces sp. TRM72054]